MSISTKKESVVPKGERTFLNIEDAGSLIGISKKQLTRVTRILKIYPTVFGRRKLWPRQLVLEHKQRIIDLIRKFKASTE